MSWTDVAALWPAVGRGVLLGLGAAMPLGPVNVEIARRVLRSGVAAGVALGLGAVTVDVIYALASAFSFVRLDDRPWVARTVGAVGVVFLIYLGVQCLRAARGAWRHDPLDEAGPDSDGSVPEGIRGFPGASADTGNRSRGADVSSSGADVSDSSGRKPASGRPVGARSAYLTGLLMTLLNPMTLGFWFTVVPATGGAIVAAAAGGPDTRTIGPDGLGVPLQAAASDLPMMCAGVFIGTATWVFGFTSLLSAAAAKAGARRPARRRAWLATADVVGGATLLGFAAAAFLRLVRSLS